MVETSTDMNREQCDLSWLGQLMNRERELRGTDEET
jgi:hypothetical protein